MSSRTILYLTDNALSEPLASLCRRVLLREAGDLPIVSVSQRPLDFGRNVCVGEIGRSWMSLYRQLLAGLEVCEEGWVVVCEHDCLYTRDHLTYEPADPTAFWNNAHHWLVEGPGTNHPELFGMYSYWPRREAMSQTIAQRDLYRELAQSVVQLIEAHQGARRAATSGSSAQLQAYLRDRVTRYPTRMFRTERPNLDVRHGGNFTGAKRGKHRCFEIPYWGRFADVMG